MTLNYGNCAKKHAPIAKKLNKFEKLPNIFHLQYDSSILLDENEMKMKIKIIIIFWVLYFLYHVRGELQKIFNMVMEGRGEM